MRFRSNDVAKVRLLVADWSNLRKGKENAKRLMIGGKSLSLRVESLDEILRSNFHDDLEESNGERK